MKFIFKPQTNLEKFGAKVYNLLVENFSQTYFVGGTVRDLLLRREIADIDIATIATPQEVMAILHSNGLKTSSLGIKFGVTVAKKGFLKAEITTFRREEYGQSRFPKVKYIKTAKEDSKRRDFTINALYLQAKTNKLLDFNKGLADLKDKKLRFIGVPKKRIEEDPIRILRGIRFAKILNFDFEKKSAEAIQKNFCQLQKISKQQFIRDAKKIKF